MPFDPLTRTNELFKSRGWGIGHVERKFVTPNKGLMSKDLFGFIDKVAVHQATGFIAGLQIARNTSGHPVILENYKKRLSNIKVKEIMDSWSKTGAILVLIWSKTKEGNNGDLWWEPRAWRYVYGELVEMDRQDLEDFLARPMTI